MREILIFIVLLIGLLLSSCKKEHKITIQAQDLITGDGSAYANMPFVVLQSRPAWNKDKVKRVYEGTLDQNGQASFFLKMHRDWSYTLNVTHPENLCYGGDLVEYLDNESNNEVVIDYLKCGKVNINHVNVNCEGEQDEFRYYYYHAIDSEIFTYWGFWNNDWTNLTGCQNATAQVYYERPTGNYIIEWEVVRPSGSTTGTDTFTVTENDSTTYLIEY